MFTRNKTLIAFIFILILFKQLMATENIIGLEWGNNIIGNTIGMYDEIKLTDKFSAGIGYKTGYLHVEVENGDGGFLMLKNVSGINNNTTISIKQLINLGAFYKRSDSQNAFFNKFGAGYSFMFFNYENSYEKTYVAFDGAVIEKKYSAAKDYTMHGFFVSSDLFSYTIDRIEYSVAIKAPFYFMKAPQYLIYTDGMSESYKNSMFKLNDSDYFIWYYPEICFNIGFKI